MSQTEITEYTKLLNEDGTLNTYGWARHNFFEYERKDAKPRSKVKEWDFYQINNGRYCVIISFFNITLMACPSISVFDLETGKKVLSKGATKLFTKHKFILPKISDTPNFFRYETDSMVLQLDTRRNCKKIEFITKAGNKIKMDAAFTIYVDKEHEGITTVTPFDAPNQFFLANKLFGMKAEGSIKFHGEEKYTFSKDNSFAIMDWGRGVWPHEGKWYWANGSQDIDGKTFGFNFTWKINEKTPDLETCLFYDGKIHKIGAVDVESFPGDSGWLNEWHLKSDDGRFDAVMKPVFDNSSKMVLNLVGQDVHQVFGIWSGKAVLDDGKEIEFSNMSAFCEYVVSKW